MLDIQKEQTTSVVQAPKTPVKVTPAGSTPPSIGAISDAPPRFSASVPLEYFLLPQKDKKKEKKEKEKEKEKKAPFSWGTPPTQVENVEQQKPKPNIATYISQEKEKKRLENNNAQQQQQKPSLATIIAREQQAKEKKLRKAAKPPKRITNIETEERAIQQITRLYADFSAVPPVSSSTHANPHHLHRSKRDMVDTRPVDICLASSF